MPILAVGLGLWLLFGVLAWRVLAPCLVETWSLVRPRLRWAFPFTVLILGVLYFRPHEDMFGGEDQGSYLNSAVTYARRQSLNYVDEMLAAVPAEARSAFYYRGGAMSRYARPVRTKLHVLRIAEGQTTAMAPWFQPAYPIMLGVPVSLGPDAWVFFATPLMALLAILMVAAFARDVLGNRAAFWAAICLGGLSGLVVWQARCVRAEWPAVVCAYGGAALLFRHIRGQRPMRDALLGAVALGAAPFFHAVAWMLAIPLAILAFAAAFAGRPSLLLYPFVLVLGALGYAWHCCYVSDGYFLADRCRPFLVYTPWIVAAAAAAAGLGWRAAARGESGAMGALAGSVARLSQRRGLRVTVAVIAGLAVCSASYLKAAVLLAPIVRLSFLDLGDLAELLSAPVSCAAMAGWFAWTLGGRERRGIRLAAAVCCLPILLIGHRFPEYMYGARYFLIGAVPAVVVCLAALVASVADRTRRGWVAAGLVLAIVAAGVPGRSHLFRVTEYEGLHRFLASVADRVRSLNGVVLFEYSRLAAPMDHFFGVPTLGVDNENTPDCEQVERSWGAVMKASRGRTPLLVTPFSDPPVSERFVFDPVGVWGYAGRRLRQERGSLPRRVEPWRCMLAVYRVRVRGEGADARSNAPVSFGMQMDAGNFGKRGFGRRRTVERVLSGVEVPAGEPVVLRAGGEGRPRERLLFLYDRGGPADLAAAPPGVEAGSVRVSWMSPAPGWWIADLGVRAPVHAACTVRLDRVMMLTDVFDAEGVARSPADCVPGCEEVRRPVKCAVRGPVGAGDAVVLLPTPANGAAFVALLATAAEASGDGATLRADPLSDGPGGARSVGSGRLQWYVWRVESGPGSGVLAVGPRAVSVEEPGRAKALIAAAAMIGDPPPEPSSAGVGDLRLVPRRDER